MKAIRIHSYGNADQLKLENVPGPELSPDWVLVRIRDAGVNPVDWKIREGYLKEWLPAKFPLTMGQDFAGEVLEAGERATRFKKGDRVFGFASGSYAEVAAARQNWIAEIPSAISDESAATLPTPGCTAYQIVLNVVKPTAGQSILIHGAAGAVGSIATQLAVWKGATVFGTASEQDLGDLRDYGVSRAIDYRNEKFDEIVKDVDVVIDLVGGETQRRSFPILKKGGLLVTTVGLDDSALPKKSGIDAVEFVMDRSATDLGALAQLVVKGVIRTKAAQVVPFIDAKQAQLASETGKSHAKIVLKVA